MSPKSLYDEEAQLNHDDTQLNNLYMNLEAGKDKKESYPSHRDQSPTNRFHEGSINGGKRDL
jgi:hypothetical protein